MVSSDRRGEPPLCGSVAAMAASLADAPSTMFASKPAINELLINQTSVESLPIERLCRAISFVSRSNLTPAISMDRASGSSSRTTTARTGTYAVVSAESPTGPS